MDPEAEELQSSEENERARRAREIAQAGLTAYRQGMSMPDEVPYMLAAPQAPAEPVEIFTNDVWPPVASPAQQQVPSTPSEIVRGMDIPRVQPRRAAPAAPAGPQAATGAPVPAGVVNLGPQPVGQAPAAPEQGVGIIPPEAAQNPFMPVVVRQIAGAEEELNQPTVYTGIPTRVRSVQTLTTPGAVSPETLQALTASDLDRRAALKFRAAQQAEGLGQQGGVFEQADVASQLEAQRQQQAAEDQARTMQWQTERADNINQQVLSGRIDPNRVLGDSFSGGRIAAALGLFISGLAQGEQGANSFLQIINQTIDRDIAAQMANMDNLRAGAQNQQNLVGMYRTVFGDETAAREAARATMLQSVAQKLQAQQARMAQAGQQPALMLALAELDAAQASAAAAAQQAQSSTVRTTTQTQSSGGTRGPNLREVEARRKLAETAGQLGANERTGIRETYETVGQLQQRASAEMSPAVRADVVEYGTRRAALNSSRARLAKIENLVSTTTSRLPWSVLGAPGTGPIGETGPAFTEEGRNLNALLNDAVSEYLLARTGKAQTALEVANARNLIIGRVSQDLPGRIASMAEELSRTRDDLDSTYGPEVVSLYQRNVASLPPPPPQPLPVQGRQQR